MPAAASKSESRASSAATRTAGPTEAVVIDPHEFDANGSRSVSPRSRANVADLRAENLGGDLRHDRARARAEVLRARQHLDGAVAVDANRGVRRRTAARAPRQRRHPDAAPNATRRAFLSASGRPAESLGALPIALVETLIRELSRLVLIVPRVVASAELEWIHPELAGQNVHRALEPKRALDVSRRAKRGHRGGVREHERLTAANILALIQLVIDLCRTRQPAADAKRARDVDVDGGERSVALRGECHALHRRHAIPGVGLLALAVENAAHRPAGLLRERGGDVRGVRRAVLRAESAAHVVHDHADRRLWKTEGLCHFAARHENALGRFPNRETSADPLGDRAVRLERGVQRDRRAILARDSDVGLAQSGVDVPARVFSWRRAVAVSGRLDAWRVSGERLLGADDGELDVDLEDDGVQRALGNLERVGADRGERLIGVLNVVIEEPYAVDFDVGDAVDRHAAAHAVERERVGQVELRHAAARNRRAQNRGVQHSGALNVGGVPSRSGDLFDRVHPRDALADDVKVGVFQPMALDFESAARRLSSPRGPRSRPSS